MRILVVEDERRMAELLRQGLTEDGHVVTVALEGRDGLSLAESGGFDLLSVPIGTALGIYGIWVLTRPETEALFAQRYRPVA